MSVRRASVLFVVLTITLVNAGSTLAVDRATIVARATKAVVVVDAGSIEGSAFSFGRPGEYLTNAHVVRHSRRVTLTDSRGRHAEAQVVALDEQTDVALLRSKLVEPRLRPAQKATRPGDTVLAIGAAAGLPGTVTEGIVSAVGRVVSGVSMIQTDAALNAGNSGGALLNESGRVVGVTSSRQLEAEGIAFAIPIATARRAVHAPSAIDAARMTPSGGSYLGVPDLIWVGILVLVGALLGGVIGWRILLARTRKAVEPTPAPPPPASQPDPVVVIRRRDDSQPPQPDSVSRTTEETWT